MARMEWRWTGDARDPGGDADALFELGILYATGRDVETDLVAAHKWFNLAAMRGNGRRSPSDRRSPADVDEQIAEAQKAAREWLATQWSAPQRQTTHSPLVGLG